MSCCRGCCLCRCVPGADKLYNRICYGYCTWGDSADCRIDRIVSDAVDIIGSCRQSAIKRGVPGTGGIGSLRLVLAGGNWRAAGHVIIGVIIEVNRCRRSDIRIGQCVGNAAVCTTQCNSVTNTIRLTD